MKKLEFLGRQRDRLEDTLVGQAAALVDAVSKYSLGDDSTEVEALFNLWLDTSLRFTHLVNVLNSQMTKNTDKDEES